MYNLSYVYLVLHSCFTFSTEMSFLSVHCFYSLVFNASLNRKIFQYGIGSVLRNHFCFGCVLCGGCFCLKRVKMRVDQWVLAVMGIRMQNDSQNDIKNDISNDVSSDLHEDEVIGAGPGEVQGDAVCGDEGKSEEEINAEIEEELEEAAELDPQAQLEGDLLKWKETAMRTAADLENYRKRMSREKAEAIKFGNQRLIEDLLPVIDNFNMGMMAAEGDSGSMIYMGMQMVQTQLEGFLSGQGVTEAETLVGSDFDPNVHDAMSQEESDEFEEGKIIRVMRKGYLLGDRLIRPANVVVSKKADEVVDVEGDSDVVEGLGE